MRIRNRILALICIVAFVGLGLLYFKTWVVQKPFAIILFISDVMTPQTLAAARIYDRGVDSRLTIENLPHLALTASYAEDLAVPDAAAAAAALSAGLRVPTDAPLPRGSRNLLELAKAQGRAIGLVTTGRIGALDTAAFLPAVREASTPGDVVGQLTGSTMPDVIFGGGEADFLPGGKGGARADNLDLLLRLGREQVELVRSEADLRDLGNFRTSKLLGLFAGGPLPLSNRGGSEPREPALPEMVRRAMQMLQNDPRGYVLVVNAEAASRAALRNDGERFLREAVVFDEAVNTAIRYAGEKALIVVTGFRGVGGLTLNASPLRTETGLAILGKNAFGVPAITWATGPAASADEADAPVEPTAYRGAEALGYATDMVATGTGDGAERLHGFLDSTAVFELLKAKL